MLLRVVQTYVLQYLKQFAFAAQPRPWPGSVALAAARVAGRAGPAEQRLWLFSNLSLLHMHTHMHYCLPTTAVSRLQPTRICEGYTIGRRLRYSAQITHCRPAFLPVCQSVSLLGSHGRRSSGKIHTAAAR